MSIIALFKRVLKWLKYDGVCPECGGYLTQDKCDSYTHIYGFYKVWTCTKCGKEWTNGTSI